jgi:hypothetical protein
MVQSTTGEIIEGLWRFEALHPEWTEDESGEDGWEPEVAWWAVATSDGLVLIDPLVKDWDALDQLVTDVGGCAGIVRTCHWHQRRVAEAASRYGAEVCAKAPRGSGPCWGISRCCPSSTCSCLTARSCWVTEVPPSELPRADRRASAGGCGLPAPGGIGGRLNCRGHGVELDPVHERVLVYRTGVGGSLAQRLAVRLPRALNVAIGDRGERDELDGVDLNLPQADSVPAALPDPRPLPQPDRHGDVSSQNVAAQLAAELHAKER